jgi:hypothetical protein
MAYAHLILEIRCAKNLASDPKLFGSQDVFVSGTVQPSGSVNIKTKAVVGGGSDPSFDASLENRLRFVLGSSDTSITLQAHSSGHVYDKVLGSVDVDVKNALERAANSEPAILSLDTIGEIHLTFRTPSSRGKHRSTENMEVAPLLIGTQTLCCAKLNCAELCCAMLYSYIQWNHTLYRGAFRSLLARPWAHRAQRPLHHGNLPAE